MTWEERMGRAGYEAYAASALSKSFNSREMPQWEQLQPRIQVAWGAAAAAVVRKHETEAKEKSP